MPRVLSIFKIRETTPLRDLTSNTHSVGDGTDSIVRLRTLCGNLKNAVRQIEVKKQFEGRRRGEAYSAAKRIPKLAAVVSLAQTCAGGNQSALRECRFSKRRVARDTHHNNAHGMQTQGLRHLTTSPVFHSVVRASGQQRAGQTR